MSFETATRFRWGEYTKTWVLRVFGVSIVCSIVVLGLTTLGWIGLLVGSVFSTVLVGAVLMWTVAEMVEDGLQSEEPP